MQEFVSVVIGDRNNYYFVEERDGMYAGFLVPVKTEMIPRETPYEAAVRAAKYMLGMDVLVRTGKPYTEQLEEIRVFHLWAEPLGFAGDDNYPKVRVSVDEIGKSDLARYVPQIMTELGLMVN